jgi:alkylhydroperoxidase family enzyme
VTSGSETLRRIAPTAADDLAAVARAGWEALTGSVGAEPAARIALACAGVHDLAPLSAPEPAGAERPEEPGTGSHLPDPWPAGDPGGRLTLRFVTQCSADVASVTEGQRRELSDALGPATVTVVAGAFVADFVPRARSALDALFGPSGSPWDRPTPDPRRPDSPTDPAAALWLAFDALIRSVPRLSALDPVTSELVRLRGARQHRCRLCQSIRSRPALVAGADDTLFDAVDHYDRPDSPLTEGQRAALAFTDAMLWTPGRIHPGTVESLQRAWSGAQQAELVLDITRNALNKVAVALGADAAHVDHGVEIYDIDESGDLVYGLSLD